MALANPLDKSASDILLMKKPQFWASRACMMESSMMQEGLNPIIPTTAYDTDADNQIPAPLYLFGDGLMVTESDYGDFAEQPPIIPKYCYDDDTLHQKPSQLQFSADHLSDETVEKIITA